MQKWDKTLVISRIKQIIWFQMFHEQRSRKMMKNKHTCKNRKKQATGVIGCLFPWNPTIYKKPLPASENTYKTILWYIFYWLFDSGGFEHGITFWLFTWNLNRWTTLLNEKVAILYRQITPNKPFLTPHKLFWTPILEHRLPQII